MREGGDAERPKGSIWRGRFSRRRELGVGGGAGGQGGHSSRTRKSGERPAALGVQVPVGELPLPHVPSSKTIKSSQKEAVGR